MKKYFFYELKNKAYVILCLAVIATLIYSSNILTTTFYGDSQQVYQFDVHLTTVYFLSIALAVIAPLIQFSYRMSRRSVDMYYSLPLSHYKIFTVRYLVGLILVFAPYFTAYLTGALIMLIKTSDRIFYGVYYLPHFFLSLPAVFCIYTIASFAFTRANKFIDGVIFIIFWLFVWALVGKFFGKFIYYDFVNYKISKVFSDYFITFAPLERLTDYFLAKLVGERFVSTMNDDVANMAAAYTLTGVTAVFATVWLFVSEKYTKSESAGQVSDSPFGYKVMIPLFTALALSFCDLSEPETYILVAMIIIGSLIATVLYRRTLKLGIRQTLILIGSVIAGIVFGAIITAIW